MRSSISMDIHIKCVSISCFLCKNLSFLCVEEVSFTVKITKSDSLQFRFRYMIIINECTILIYLYLYNRR